STTMTEEQITGGRRLKSVCGAKSTLALRWLSWHRAWGEAAAAVPRVIERLKLDDDEDGPHDAQPLTPVGLTSEPDLVGQREVPPRVERETLDPAGRVAIGRVEQVVSAERDRVSGLATLQVPGRAQIHHRVGIRRDVHGTPRDTRLRETVTCFGADVEVAVVPPQMAAQARRWQEWHVTAIGE